MFYLPGKTFDKPHTTPIWSVVGKKNQVLPTSEDLRQDQTQMVCVTNASRAMVVIRHQKKVQFS